VRILYNPCVRHLMDLSILARYPIHPEAGDYLKEQNVTLDDLVFSPAYAQARDAGRRRVLEAWLDGRIGEHALTAEVERIVELLSYVVARIIVSCTADDHLVQRYALAEAETAESRLLDEDLDFVMQMAGFLELDVARGDDSDITVHFTDYLRHSSQMRAPEWKLAVQELVNGRVTVDKRRLVRLIQNAIQERIAGELPLPVNDAIIDAFASAIWEVRDEVAKRKAQFEKETYGKVSFLRLPPCMKRLMGMMKKGENVPHVGRFGLTAFLHTVGMSNEKIVAVFSVSPDFNEHLARYQIDHITGKTSGIEYIPPECDTMKSRGVCFDPDELCAQKWMNHPLTYYRIKGKKKKPKAALEESASE
jgi:DNA primase large subunit